MRILFGEGNGPPYGCQVDMHFALFQAAGSGHWLVLLEMLQDSLSFYRLQCRIMFGSGWDLMYCNKSNALLRMIGTFACRKFEVFLLGLGSHLGQF